MRTTINGQDAEWSEEIRAKWHTFADAADPKLMRGVVLSANYYTPRPYVDEYNRGSGEEGFVYSIKLPDRELPYVWQAVIARHRIVRKR
jgi:hypothetical protein